MSTKVLFIAAVLLGSFGIAKASVTYEFVDLTPPGYSSSDALGIVGNQVYGGAWLGVEHAGYWPGGASSFVNLTPTTYTQAQVSGSDGTNEVGFGGVNGNAHALLWSGTAGSVVDLTPANYTNAMASGVSNGVQVGGAYNNNPATDEHAMLWTGTAASAVDLHPQGYAFSNAANILGNQEIGGAWTNAGNEHAALWHGTAASFVDLNPTGFITSTAYAQSQSQIVGWGFPQSAPQDERALLWTDPAASPIDLTPQGFVASLATATNGSEQVGDAQTSISGTPHPMVWSGSAASAIDLSSYLPAGYTEAGVNGINDQGVIVGQATIITQGGGESRAYELIPVPEPSTFGVIGIAALAATLRIRRR
jgi:hypothetical protein